MHGLSTREHSVERPVHDSLPGRSYDRLGGSSWRQSDSYGAGDTRDQRAPATLRDSFMAWWPDHLRAQSPHEPMSAARRRALVISYLPDWITSIALLAVFEAIDQIDGFHRQFSLTDTSIQHTYAVHERVPVWLLIVLAVVVPAGSIAVIAVAFRRSVWDLHNGLLGLLLAISTTTVCTDAIKLTVGRPRPDLIDRCQPRAGAANAAVYGLADSSICTQTDQHILRDGFRSFISGHSSTAFAGLGFLSLYLSGKLHIYNQKGYSLKIWIALAPLQGATLIAISRTMDYRHHATDVIAGGIVGFALAYCAYGQYFPALGSPDSHLPFAPRIQREGARSTEAAFGPGEHVFDHLSADRRGAQLSHGLHRPEHGTVARPSVSDEDDGHKAPSESFNLV